MFDGTCKACHTIGGGKLVGPDLSGVTDRRSEDWLKSFIKSSQGMINSGDADAVAIYEEYNKTLMPDAQMSDAEIAAVIAYVGSGGSGDAGAAVVAAEPGDPERGEQYFLGLSRMENNGPSCNSCHNVDYNELLAGGALAKDLTKVVTRLSEPGVNAMMSNAPFPAMQKAYVNAPLTAQEIADITAFLTVVDEASVTPVQNKSGMTLLYSSIAGVTILLGFFSVIWMRRRRGSVNDRIFNRQVNSE